MKRAWQFFLDWRAEVFAILVIAAAFAVTPAQTMLLVYKAAKLLVGVVIGYWSFVFALGRYPDAKNVRDRYVVAALMAAGMVGMGGVG